MKLTKVHRVISFDQSPWIKPYIELNTQLRQKAACKAEEELPKLMNNSFFGECIVVVRGVVYPAMCRQDLRGCLQIQRCQAGVWRGADSKNVATTILTPV